MNEDEPHERTEPVRDAKEEPVAPVKGRSPSGTDVAGIRASARRDPLTSGLARTLRDLDMCERISRDLGMFRSPIDDLMSGRGQLSSVARAIEQADKAMKAAVGFAAFENPASRASMGLQSLGGIEKVMRQQRELDRTLFGLGRIDQHFARHSAIHDAVSALGGVKSIMKRHDELQLLSSSTRLPKTDTAGTSLAVSRAMESAMRDIAGVSSFTGLLASGRLGRSQLDALVSGTQAWRTGPGNLSLAATLHGHFPDLVPERRTATMADFARVELSRLGERFTRNKARLETLQGEMLSQPRAWVDVGNPRQSVSAYVDARALATIVHDGPPQSRAVVAAVREELGDYRETDPVPEVVAADPVLRSAFRLEVGFNADLSTLPPAILATIFSPFGGGIERDIEADPEALESAVHQRARRLELKLRRFIEKKMAAKLGPKWSKQRVPGKTVTGWRARRQTDIDNGRTPSRLFDYAGFEDYRAIIEQKENWPEIFEPIFKVKTSILETLRRLSLIRNPDAHYRIVTIDDFLDLHTEGRRLDAWIDAAS